VLRDRFGSVTIRFGEPISLAAQLGQAIPRRFGPGQIPDLRPITAEFGVEITRRINDLVTAGRSAVAAAALLGQPSNALREEELRARVVEIAALLELLGVARSEALERCLATGRPEATLELLEAGGRVKRVASPRGDLVQIGEGMRPALDLYRASLGHLLVWPAALALALRAPLAREPLLAEASGWLDLFFDEYFPVEGEARRQRLLAVLAHLDARGWVASDSEGLLRPTEAGAEWIAFFRAQQEPLIEAYAAVARVVAEAEGLGEREALRERVTAVQKEDLLIGEARYPEGRCPVAIANALERLVHEGILAPAPRAPKGGAGFVPGPRFAALDALRGRLAAALASR